MFTKKTEISLGSKEGSRDNKHSIHECKQLMLERNLNLESKAKYAGINEMVEKKHLILISVNLV